MLTTLKDLQFLENLTVVNCSQNKLPSLAGLENAINLTEITISPHCGDIDLLLSFRNLKEIILYDDAFVEFYYDENDTLKDPVLLEMEARGVEVGIYS
jgi:hypothetical protein